MTAPQHRVTPRILAEMHFLADEGLCRSDIAAITGFSVITVGKRIGHRLPALPHRQADVDRYRRMIAANAMADYGTRDDVARRFGLKDRKSLCQVLWRGRRIVEAANQCPSPPDTEATRG